MTLISIHHRSWKFPVFKTAEIYCDGLLSKWGCVTKLPNLLLHKLSPRFPALFTAESLKAIVSDAQTNDSNPCLIFYASQSFWYKYRTKRVCKETEIDKRAKSLRCLLWEEVRKKRGTTGRSRPSCLALIRAPLKHTPQFVTADSPMYVCFLKNIFLIFELKKNWFVYFFHWYTKPWQPFRTGDFLTRPFPPPKRT